LLGLFRKTSLISLITHLLRRLRPLKASCLAFSSSRLISRTKRKAWEAILTIPTIVVVATTAMAGEAGAMAATSLAILTTTATTTIIATTIT
jgi:acetyl-CoA carboxylase carboxyltransferase component